jgi:hypothetical protein
MNIPDHISPSSGNLFDPVSGIKKFRSEIRDKHSGSATLNPSDLKKSVFADPVDCLHEVEDVVSAVHEEAGDNDV